MATFIDNADGVRVPHGGEPVRDDDGGAAARRRLQRRLHRLQRTQTCTLTNEVRLSIH